MQKLGLGACQNRNERIYDLTRGISFIKARLSKNSAKDGVASRNSDLQREKSVNSAITDRTIQSSAVGAGGGTASKAQNGEESSPGVSNPVEAIRSISGAEDSSPKTVNPMEAIRSISGEDSSPKTVNPVETRPRRASDASSVRTSATHFTFFSKRTNTAYDIHIPEWVKYDQFRAIVRDADSKDNNRLLNSCKQDLRRGNNMWNLTSRLAEYNSVKVALCILLLLLVLPFLEPTVQDFSPQYGLEHLDLSMSLSRNGTVWNQVDLWLNGRDSGDNQLGELVYLDLGRRLFCNRLLADDPLCYQELPDNLRHLRKSLSEIDADIDASDFRKTDLEVISVPNPDKYDVNDEDVTSVAVVNRREKRQQEAISFLVTTIFVMMVILMGITFLTQDLSSLSKNLLYPLRDLADDMESMAHLEIAGASDENEEEEYSMTRGVRNRNMEISSEVHVMRKTFHRMKKAIVSWGKYVPWPVVRQMLRSGIEAELEVENMNITMFFSDIAGFTTIVESVPPEKSLLLLSRYFTDMSRVIDEHGGIVLEFVGDAILAIYGAPSRNEDHAEEGVRATLRMQGALKRINEWSTRQGLPEINIRCGIHTGDVLVGNMGFRSRMKYGIVGEDVHIPSHLEEHNKQTKTAHLISQATREMLPEGTFIIRPVDYVYLQHAASSTSELVYEVMGLNKGHKKSADLSQAAEKHAKALELYHKQNFVGAEQLFQEVHTQMSTIRERPDEVSKAMIDRCRTLQKQPPAADWDGVWNH